MLDALGKLLEDAVDKIGTHRIAGVKAHHQLAVAGLLRTHIEPLHRPHATAATHHIGRQQLHALEQPRL